MTQHQIRWAKKLLNPTLATTASTNTKPGGNEAVCTVPCPP